MASQRVDRVSPAEVAAFAGFFDVAAAVRARTRARTVDAAPDGYVAVQVDEARAQVEHSGGGEPRSGEPPSGLT